MVGRRRVGGLGSPVSRRVRFPSGPDRSGSCEGRDLPLVVLVRCEVSSSSLGRRDVETAELGGVESSVERRTDATPISSSSLASSSRTRTDSRPLSDSTSSRLRTQSSRERLPSQAASVPEDPCSVNVVPRLLDLESEPMSAGSDGCRSRKRWDSRSRSQVGLNLLLGGVTLFVGGGELLRSLLNPLSLVGHLDLSLSLSVRLIEGSLVEGSGGRRESVSSLLLVGVLEVVSVGLSCEHGGLLGLSDELLLELLSLLVNLR